MKHRNNATTPADDDRDTMVRIRMSLHKQAKDLAWRDRLDVREWYERAVMTAIEAEAKSGVG